MCPIMQSGCMGSSRKISGTVLVCIIFLLSFLPQKSSHQIETNWKPRLTYVHVDGRYEFWSYAQKYNTRNVSCSLSGKSCRPIVLAPFGQACPAKSALALKPAQARKTGFFECWFDPHYIGDLRLVLTPDPLQIYKDRRRSSTSRPTVLHSEA